MGCNIHVHVEVNKDGKWYHFGQPDVRRDYRLFATIAGERLDDLRESDQKMIQPVAHIHEIPNDVSFVTHKCYEQDKSNYHLHNEGVLTAEDLPCLQDRLYEYNPQIQRTGCDELDLEASIFGTYINGNTLTQHQGWDNLRIVFWFDN